MEKRVCTVTNWLGWLPAKILRSYSEKMFRQNIRPPTIH